MNRWIIRKLSKMIKKGRLHINCGDWSCVIDGQESGQIIDITLRTKRNLNALINTSELSIGEMYMSGDLTLNRGSLENFFIFCNDNSSDHSPPFSTPIIQRLKSIFTHFNYPLGHHLLASRKNVAHHYDLTDELFDSFLDSWRQYSCAYFHSPQVSLQEAQIAKLARLAGKLHIGPEMDILDIGCGWGGLGLALAGLHSDAHITGVTLSSNQHDFFQNAIEKAKLTHRITCRLLDYRQLDQPFDRIISVGMLEHVGYRHLGQFFDTVSRLLKPNGVAVIHAIGRFGPPKPTNKWIEKYIFPGGYLPTLDQIMPCVMRSGLQVMDVEILRLHYAETLKAWRTNFEANIEMLSDIYDEQFIRMWRFYLIGSEYYFRSGTGMVFQLQLAHNGTPLPQTRDYIDEYQKQAEKWLNTQMPFGTQNH